MVPCPSCKQVAFAAGRCRSCGFQVVQGQRSAAPAPLPAEALQPILDPSALVEVADPKGGGPTMPGFESTSLVLEADPGTPDPSSRQLAACPRCRAEQPAPMPAVCDRCGFRLKTRRPRAEGVDEDGMKECSECRLKNDPERTTCINCSYRLSDD